MARVIAIERGHCGLTVREEGEEFDVPDARLKDGSKWFVPVEKRPAPKPKAPAVGARPPGAGPLPGSRTELVENTGKGEGDLA